MIHFFKLRIASFAPAVQGLHYVISTQKNSWIHGCATILAILLSIWLRISWTDFAIILFTIGLVWVAEIINTSIEAVVDLTSPQKNILAKIAKDTGAGAVLLAAILSVMVGLAIFLPPFLHKIGLD